MQRKRADVIKNKAVTYYLFIYDFEFTFSCLLLLLATLKIFFLLKQFDFNIKRHKYDICQSYM